MATLRHNMANYISVLWSAGKLFIIKMAYPRNISFKSIERLSPNVVVDIDRKSSICFGERISMHSNCRVVSLAGGCLKIGDNTSFNVGCMIACRHSIEIGKNVSFGPNVMIYDHDHIMGADGGVKNTPFKLKNVVIGDNSWIGAGTIILAGTHIGKNCIIAAGSVVKGDIPDNTTLIQKRENTFLELG